MIIYRITRSNGILFIKFKINLAVIYICSFYVQRENANIYKRVTWKIPIFPVKLFIRILSIDKKIFITVRSQFIYQTDSVIAHIDRIYYISRAYIAFPNHIDKE